MHPITEGRILLTEVSRRFERWRLVLQLRPAVPLVLGTVKKFGLIGMRRAGLKIGTLAVAFLREIDHGIEHPLREVVRIRDLRRERAKTFVVHIRDVLLQTQFTNFIPYSVPGFGRNFCYCCHDFSSSSLYDLDSTTNLALYA